MRCGSTHQSVIAWHIKHGYHIVTLHILHLRNLDDWCLPNILEIYDQLLS